MNKAVLFDFDGTLFFGTAKLNAWCFQRALQQMGLPEPTSDMINQTVGMTFQNIARLMTRSEDEALHKRFAEATFSYAPEYIRQYVHPAPDVRSMLAALHQRAKLAICSNAIADYLLPMIKALEIENGFDLIWPYSEGYSKATAIPCILRKLACETGVFVGDRLEDVTAGRENGMAVVGIRNPVYPRETDGADKTVNNHQDMLRAILALLKEE